MNEPRSHGVHRQLQEKAASKQVAGYRPVSSCLMTQCYWVTFTHFLLLLQLISHNRNAYQASQSRLGSKIKESVSVPSRSTAHPSEYVFDEQFVNPFLLKRVKLLCDRHITQKTVKADCKDYCYCTACLLNKRDEVLLELR